MVERGREPRLAQEALPEAWIDGELGSEHLQRDAASEPDVLGSVDDAHAAAADLGFHPVVGQLLAEERVRAGRPRHNVSVRCGRARSKEASRSAADCAFRHVVIRLPPPIEGRPKVSG